MSNYRHDGSSGAHQQPGHTFKEPREKFSGQTSLCSRLAPTRVRTHCFMPCEYGSELTFSATSPLQ
ncbi:hypothetical protein M378DRAFT_162525 [Amanita muscaria Koide BX008]|uniref:Uncharacterized protein n=1 Tax=Amanita muscaria (strain Koide BX008) TaxID=946122 RepID=A0A0C2X868_AMAMK|nr:hypothetical protein M378DRAFT_162525 [Amanita muscaria Koide BX008]